MTAPRDDAALEGVMVKVSMALELTPDDAKLTAFWAYQIPEDVVEGDERDLPVTMADLRTLLAAVTALRAARDAATALLDLAKAEAPVVESNIRADERAAVLAEVRAMIEVERANHALTCLGEGDCDCGAEGHNVAIDSLLDRLAGGTG